MPKNNINSAKATDSSQSALSQLDFCALLNISADCIESFHISINPAEDYRREIFITLKPSYPLCPICGSRSLIKGFYLRKIKYELLGNHNTVLFHKDRRYQCVSCGKTHFAPSPFTMENSRISISTTLNVLEDLKSPNLTFSECAKKNHISATSVAYIFDSHVDIKRKQLPAFLCIDEVYASVSRKSKYICVLLDYKNREPVDVLESRWKMTLEKYFLNIPGEERDSVKVFCSDMYEPYRIVKKNLLPKAIHIVDRFHVAQDFNRLITKYRIKLMNRYPKDSNEYYLLKKFNYLLFQSDESRLDPNAKRQFNRKLNRYCNYYELRDLLLKTDPELERVVNMKDRLYLFYDCHIISEDNTEVPQEAVPELKRNSYGDVSKKSLRAQNEAKKRNSRTRITIEEAYKKLDEIICEFAGCGIEEIMRFAGTLTNWRDEIVNSLIVFSSLNYRKVNNALIENRNKMIKNLKHTSNGYKNKERFRNRILYTLQKDATYHLTPIQHMEDLKRHRNRNSYLKRKQYQLEKAKRE